MLLFRGFVTLWIFLFICVVGSALRWGQPWPSCWPLTWEFPSAPPTVRSAPWCPSAGSGPNRTLTGSSLETSSWPGWGPFRLPGPSAHWPCTYWCLPSEWPLGTCRERCELITMLRVLSRGLLGQIDLCGYKVNIPVFLLQWESAIKTHDSPTS